MPRSRAAHVPLQYKETTRGTICGTMLVLRQLPCCVPTTDYLLPHTSMPVTTHPRSEHQQCSLHLHNRFMDCSLDFLFCF